MLFQTSFEALTLSFQFLTFLGTHCSVCVYDSFSLGFGCLPWPLWYLGHIWGEYEDCFERLFWRFQRALKKKRKKKGIRQYWPISIPREGGQPCSRLLWHCIGSSLRPKERLRDKAKECRRRRLAWRGVEGWFRLQLYFILFLENHFIVIMCDLMVLSCVFAPYRNSFVCLRETRRSMRCYCVIIFFILARRHMLFWEEEYQKVSIVCVVFQKPSISISGPWFVLRTLKSHFPNIPGNGLNIIQSFFVSYLKIS